MTETIALILSTITLLLNMPRTLIDLLNIFQSNSSITKTGTVVKDRKESLISGLCKLNELVGINDFKNLVNDFIVSKEQADLDAQVGINNKIANYNMVITGNPGSGKTTVASLLGEIYYGAGIINENKVIEVSRQDIVSTIIGGTEKNFKEILKKAEGGILFIDEAYSLLTTADYATSRDFGKIVLDMLTKAVDDNKCIIILAGYPVPMDRLLNYNEGLTRRFPNRLEMPDFSSNQCYEIFANLCSKSNFILDKSAKEVLLKHFDQAKIKKGFGNGGYVRNLFDATLLVRNRILSKLPKDGVSSDDRRVIKESFVTEAISAMKV